MVTDMTDESEFPLSLGKVARRQLAANGITKYDQLPLLTPGDLLAIHGVGPKAIRILTEELTHRGLRFRQ
jgi:predicted flap endonuclease-1-like 5' DNA nuclease